MVLKFHPAPRFTKRPERVNVAMARLIPVAKLYSQFERCPRLAHELRLVDPEHVVEDFDMRQRRLADADGSDLIRFDQGDRVVFCTELPPDAGRAHPPGRTAAHDDDAVRPRSIVMPGGFAHMRQNLTRT